MSRRSSDAAARRPESRDEEECEAMTAQPENIESTLLALKTASGHERVSVENVLDAFGQRAYGPVFFSLGLVGLSPIGAIPGASIVCATLVLLLAVQMGLRNGPPWIPGRLARLEMDAARMRDGITRVEPWLMKLDAVIRPRWLHIVDRPVFYVVALSFLALMMFPLALIPWGVTPVVLAIAVLGLGLLGRDGLVTLIGFIFSGLGAGGGVYLLMAA